MKKLFVDTDLVEPDNQRLSSSRQVLRLLAAFPDLADDAFYLLWEGGPIVPEPGLCVTLPHLRRLTLEGYSPFKGFAACLTLPPLRTLIVRSDVYKEADSARVLSNVSSGLVELLHQFGPSLTRLVPTQEAFHERALALCVGDFVNITDFKLLGAKYIPGVFISKGEGVLPPCACPT